MPVKILLGLKSQKIVLFGNLFSLVKCTLIIIVNKNLKDNIPVFIFNFMGLLKITYRVLAKKIYTQRKEESKKPACQIITTLPIK